MEKFGHFLPHICDLAGMNDIKLKSEYLNILQTRFLEVIQSQVPKDHFEMWFDGKVSIEDIKENNQVFLGTDDKLNAEWLKLRYSKLLENILTTITDGHTDFELSFVVRNGIEANTGKTIESKEYEKCSKELSFEELFKLAFGKKELERQKGLLLMRIKKSDYASGEINLIECPICDCEDVPNVDLERKLDLNNSRLKSITIRGGRCSNCSEEFYKQEDIDAIAKIKELLEGLFPST